MLYFFQAEDGIRDGHVTGVQTCALPIFIITRFPPEPMDGMHGHHTASARLAIEALDAAADSTAFPEQLALVSTWRATRVVFNDFRGIWDAGEGLPAVEMETGGFDAVSGSFYGEIAARSRSMHKSQGFGAVAARGHRIERFIHLAASRRRSLCSTVSITRGYATMQEGTSSVCSTT